MALEGLKKTRLYPAENNLEAEAARMKRAAPESFQAEER